MHERKKRLENCEKVTHYWKKKIFNKLLLYKNSYYAFFWFQLRFYLIFVIFLLLVHWMILASLLSAARNAGINRWTNWNLCVLFMPVQVRANTYKKVLISNAINWKSVKRHVYNEKNSNNTIHWTTGEILAILIFACFH